MTEETKSATEAKQEAVRMLALALLGAVVYICIVSVVTAFVNIWAVGAGGYLLVFGVNFALATFWTLLSAFIQFQS